MSESKVHNTQKTKWGNIWKSSLYINKLYKWFGENYPDEYLYCEV